MSDTHNMIKPLNNGRHPKYNHLVMAEIEPHYGSYILTIMGQSGSKLISEDAAKIIFGADQEISPEIELDESDIAKFSLIQYMIHLEKTIEYDNKMNIISMRNKEFEDGFAYISDEYIDILDK